MATAARHLAPNSPETRKAGTTTMPASHNFFNNSDSGHSETGLLAQPLQIVPRIILTHWLRSDLTEAANYV